MACGRLGGVRGSLTQAVVEKERDERLGCNSEGNIAGKCGRLFSTRRVPHDVAVILVRLICNGVDVGLWKTVARVTLFEVPVEVLVVFSWQVKHDTCCKKLLGTGLDGVDKLGSIRWWYLHCCTVNDWWFSSTAASVRDCKATARTPFTQSMQAATDMGRFARL